MIKVAAKKEVGSVTPPAFKFIKQELKPTEKQIVEGLDVNGCQLQNRLFEIALKGKPGKLEAHQWLLGSCACMGLSHFNYLGWPEEAVPDFLVFLSTLRHRGDWAPKKFYFCIKTHNGGFQGALIKEARLVDTFINKAHISYGELGLYTLEFPE